MNLVGRRGTQSSRRSLAALGNGTNGIHGVTRARARWNDAQPKEHPHRRHNPLTNEWVLVSPHRTQRPWQGQVEEVAPQHQPEYDPKCYLCPGNERAGGKRNPAYTCTFVFDNDFSALVPNTPSEEINEGDLLIAKGEPGICRVVCFSPRHDLTL